LNNPLEAAGSLRMIPSDPVIAGGHHPRRARELDAADSLRPRAGDPDKIAQVSSERYFAAEIMVAGDPVAPLAAGFRGFHEL